MGRVNVPLYQGGGVAARIRQAKRPTSSSKRKSRTRAYASTPR